MAPVPYRRGRDAHEVSDFEEISELIDEVRISRQTVTDGPGGVGTSRGGEDVRVLRPGDIRRIRERRALVVAGNAPPIIARLQRCIDGRAGRALLHDLDQARARVGHTRGRGPDLAARTRYAITYSREHHLHAADQPPDDGDGGVDEPTGDGEEQS